MSNLTSRYKSYIELNCAEKSCQLTRALSGGLSDIVNLVDRVHLDEVCQELLMIWLCLEGVPSGLLVATKLDTLVCG